MSDPASPFNSLVPEASGRGASASVPIAVYYQLAEELRGLKAQLAAAAERNTALADQNQQLRAELERLVAAAMQVQQLPPPQPEPLPLSIPTDATTALDRTTDRTTASPPPLTFPRGEELDAATPPVPVPLGAVTGGPDAADWDALPGMAPVDELFSEQPVNPFPDPPSDRAKAPSGNWWTVVAIAAIGAMAFGVSFAIVRPLTQGQR